jgi:hypothetical protein
LQDEILSALSEFAKKNDFPFVLTGGTALVRFLLKSSYRVSYDLDFFSVRNISDKEVQEVISFLSQRFDVRFKGVLGIEEIPIFKYEIVSRNIGIKLDFVQDPFAGIFVPQFLEGTNLMLDSVFAIYFRKLYAVLSASLQGIAIDRIKDILDLMELDRNVKPLPDFVFDDFCKVWRQNFPTKIDPDYIRKTLRRLFLDIGYRKEEVASVLEEIYFSNRTVEEIERWLLIQQEKIRVKGN